MDSKDIFLEGDFDMPDDDYQPPNFEIKPELSDSNILLPHSCIQSNLDPLNKETATSEFTLHWLNKIYENQSKYKKELVNTHTLLINFYNSGSSQIMQQLNSIFPQIQKEITHDQQTLQYIDTTCLLNPIEMERFDFLKQEIGNQLAQLELYHQEFQSLSNNAPNNACKLKIIGHPFPCVVVKDKPVGPITVQLLEGATVKVLSCSEITASLVFPNNKTKITEKGNLLNDLKKKMDPTSHIASFSPKFLKGSKMQFIRFRFSATVKVEILPRSQQHQHQQQQHQHQQHLSSSNFSNNNTHNNNFNINNNNMGNMGNMGNGGNNFPTFNSNINFLNNSSYNFNNNNNSHNVNNINNVGNSNNVREFKVVSEDSEEFVVLSNEAQQWLNSEKGFIEHVVFEGKNNSSWFKFVNRIQRQILIATKQSPPYKRFLTVHEISYIHSTYFDSKDSISTAAFDSFWNKAGKCIRSLRFSWNLCPLWLEGFFFGFIAKNVAEQILDNQNKGTFLLRWSETTGAVDVVYSTGDQIKVRHCLFNSPVKVSLPDFLRDNQPLTNFFRIIPTISYTQFNVVSVSKDLMLQPFYSKRTPKPEEKHDGYENEIKIGLSLNGFSFTSNNEKNLNF